MIFTNLLGSVVSTVKIFCQNIPGNVKICKSIWRCAECRLVCYNVEAQNNFGEATETLTLAVVGFPVVQIAIIPLVRDRNYRFKGTGKKALYPMTLNNAINHYLGKKLEQQW